MFCADKRSYYAPLSLYFWSTRIALHDSKIKIILIYLTLYLTEALNKSHLGFFNTKPTD